MKRYIDIFLLLLSMMFLQGCVKSLPPKPIAHTKPPVFVEKKKPVLRPGDMGTFKVKRWEYGSDSDKKTTWYDISKYYGTLDKRVTYKPGKVPLKGIVYYPEGKGPFPLVMVVHGNFENPLVHSEEGYDYILKNLASHGFIAASISMNFLNGKVSGEMEARSILILQHLKLFRKWYFEPGTPMQSIIDLNNIGLIGHSRGGEAAAGAAFLNIKLHNPKNYEFNFNFKIKSILTMAPTDERFPVKGGSSSLIPNNVEYFMMLGSRDTGTYSFKSVQFFSKLFHSSRGFRGTKSMLWLYGANHSNWNTVWYKAFERAQIPAGSIPPEVQRQISLTYCSAYFMMTLYGKEEYRTLFQGNMDFAGVRPEVTRVYQYQDKKSFIIDDYETDYPDILSYNPLELLSPFEVRSFAHDVNYTSYHLSELSKGLILGWEGGSSAQYIIRPPKSLDVKKYPFLAFRVAQIYNKSYGHEAKDFSISIVSKNGNSKDLKASDYGYIPYPDVFIRGKRDLTKSMLKTVRIPLADFFNAKQKVLPPTRIVYKFNLDNSGLLAFDDIQITK